MELNQSRYSVIKAVTSPLGFFALSLLTVEIFLAIVLIYSGLDQKSKFIGMLIGAGLFLAVIIIVTILVFFAPKKLLFGEEGHLLEEGKIPYGEPGSLLTRQEIENQTKIEAQT